MLLEVLLRQREVLFNEKKAESLLSSLELSNWEFLSLELENCDFSSLELTSPSSVLLLRSLALISEDGRGGFFEIKRDTFA